MKNDTMQKTFLRIGFTLIRRRGKKEGIMLMLQKMKNHLRKELDMKVKIIQVRMNMF